MLHREHGGGVHAHALTARCDLETGRKPDIAPPGSEDLDPLRDTFNHEHGWSRPDDPARVRTQQPDHRAHIEAANLRAGLEHEARVDPGPPGARVEHGVVQSCADVVTSRPAGRTVAFVAGRLRPARNRPASTTTGSHTATVAHVNRRYAVSSRINASTAPAGSATLNGKQVISRSPPSTNRKTSVSRNASVLG